MSNSRKPSRREFLQGAAAAGLAVAGGLSMARAAHAQEGGPLRLGLIGCGSRGKGAVHDCLGARSDVKLVAVADAFNDQAERAVKGFHEKFPKEKAEISADRIFVGLDAYQKVLASDVDLVLLATPPGFRPLHYAAAIQAGKHVFMEKPCCVDAAGYRVLVEANKLADEKGLKVGVGLQRRHELAYREGVKRLQDGELGALTLLRTYWNGTTPWIRPRLPDQSEMKYQVHNWYFFVWLSGDHICEQHVHNLDVANWIKDGHPVEANGMGGRQVRKGKDTGHIFDHHFVEFTYADGTKLYSQCRQQSGAWEQIGEYARGALGGRAVKLKDKQLAGDSPLQQEHAELIDAIRNGAKYNEGWYGATSSMTAVLGRMATYSGQVVTWDEAVAQGGSESPEKLTWDASPRILPDKDGSYEHAVAVPGVYKPY